MPYLITGINRSVVIPEAIKPQLKNLTDNHDFPIIGHGAGQHSFTGVQMARLPDGQKWSLSFFEHSYTFNY